MMDGLIVSPPNLVRKDGDFNPLVHFGSLYLTHQPSVSHAGWPTHPPLFFLLKIDRYMYILYSLSLSLL